MYKRCFRFDLKRLQELKDSGRKLAHYTSAENGLNIIKGKTIWLRNAAVMNDFSEIEHGRACLNWALQNTNLLSRLAALIEPHHPNLCQEVLQWLNEADLDARLFTYITALSEHSADDEVGRLSMWRAYGGNAAGVALVMNTDFLDLDDTQLEAVTSPVLYGGPQRLAEEMQHMVVALEEAPDLIKAVPTINAKSILFHAFRYAILSTKHPSFEEEQEWRVLHSPRQSASAFIEAEPVAIKGIAQLVYKLPLENKPGLNMPQVDLDRLVHRVIIGPTQYPYTVAEAYDEALTRAGVKDAGQRIKISHIPLRHFS
jgi:hypothetical protein